MVHVIRTNLKTILNHNWLRKQTTFTKNWFKCFNYTQIMKFTNISQVKNRFNKDKTNLMKTKQFITIILLGLAKKGWLPVFFFTDF